MSRVLVAMSGGVDSSVAAALLQREGHEVVGVTMKLWGGASDTGCCSVSDVDDARRVADALGMDHHVFNFGDDFERWVVGPYVADHQAGRTPNPCIECNRHLKFDRLVRRAEALGFDAVATGHHARIVDDGSGTRFVGRGADRAKDQSYVLHMLDQDQLARLLFPIGAMTKPDVRALAAEAGIRTAAKPDSQDVCFITSTSGRGAFLSDRVELTPGRVVDTAGTEIGRVDAVQLVTIGQRRGIDIGGHPDRRYVVDVDVGAARVTIGPKADLSCESTALVDLAWTAGRVDGDVLAQTSAHGEVAAGAVRGGDLRWSAPHRRVAPGQSVVLYRDDAALGEIVVGGATAA
ncbi:MAG: tRNA 2-thiouridine(34) synthase MnmA [Acidimicrobiia bacterium]|nr:tRNA 2-thiouridine(34) synthase MnmA [Acidimicrobiia bacterium]